MDCRGILLQILGYGIVVRMFQVGETLVPKIHKNILKKVIFIKERNSFQANQGIAFIVKLSYRFGMVNFAKPINKGS